MVSRNPADFGIEELLISRTDKRGVILAANQSFQRVAGYEWSELQNAPHKIVRHADMPKGVFFLLWEQLKQGEPVGGFIKNATKDGGYYWVFATIATLEDGYMSMRILPSKEKLAMIEPIYAELCAFEKDKAHSPQESAARLREILVEKGYASYTSFMTEMVSQEIVARNQSLQVPQDNRIARLTAVLKDWPMVGEECDRVFRAYEEFGAAPLNMRIQASQLKEQGIALGVISSNFAELAAHINTGLGEFSESVDDVARTIYRSMFLTCTQRLLAEAQDVLSSEEGDGATPKAELNILRSTRSTYEAKAVEGLYATSAKLTRFITLALSIKRSLSGLSVTRVMSAIENAQLKNSGDNSISAIIEELRIFQEVTDTSLMSIQGHLTRLRLDVQRSTQNEQRQKAIA